MYNLDGNLCVKNKAQRWVFETLEDIVAQLPFPLRGIDSDNGGEFINDHLLRYCLKHKITFTRSRLSGIIVMILTKNFVC